MQVIPVIDILGGVVVRGVGGRRDEYRPLVSQLTTSTEPLAVARALREVCRPSPLYVADLDAIVHRRPNGDLYQVLIAEGCRLLIDAGVRTVAEAEAVAATGADVIIGLETIPDPATLRAIVDKVSSERVVFSVDLKAGQSLGGTGWPTDVSSIIEQAIASGVQRMIVLDLADVGSMTGGTTAALCQQIRQRWPTLELIAGGGVRNKDDLTRWSQIGVDAVLVASALHDGRLTKNDLAEISQKREVGL